MTMSLLCNCENTKRLQEYTIRTSQAKERAHENSFSVIKTSNPSADDRPDNAKHSYLEFSFFACALMQK